MSACCAVACDNPPAATDAGPRSDAGADAGPVATPEVSFAAAATSGAGPWARWGFQVARMDDSTAIVIGGTDAGQGSTVFGDTYRVDVAADGTLTATEIETSGPEPRYCGCATWDAARERVIVFGGRNLEGPATLAVGTWELDPATGTWTESPTSSDVWQPSSTLGCAMAYDAGTENTYMFGGAGGSGDYSQLTYRYDVSTGGWSELDAFGPLARYDAVFFPSPIHDSLLLFGGSLNATGAAFYSDLWRFDPSRESWALVDLPEGPAGRRMAWVAPDPATRGLFVGFGTDGTPSALGDLHYIDLLALTWTEIELPFDTSPVARGFSPALPGGEGGLATMIGGFASNRVVEESWRLVR